MYVTVCVCICFCTAGLVVIRTVIRNSKFEAWVQGARFVHFSRRPLLFFFFLDKRTAMTLGQSPTR